MQVSVDLKDGQQRIDIICGGLTDSIFLLLVQTVLDWARDPNTTVEYLPNGNGTFPSLLPPEEWQAGAIIRLIVQDSACAYFYLNHLQR